MLQINTDNIMNDNSTIIASPINLGFPKGIATTPNPEIKIIVINTRLFTIINHSTS